MHFEEFKFGSDTKDGCHVARYGMVAMAKSGGFIDTVYVMYKMSFEELKGKYSILWGLYEYEIPIPQENELVSQLMGSNLFKNYFRKKALEGFYNKGIIDSINYVRNREEIPNLLNE